MNVVFDFGAVLFTWRPVDLMAECFPKLAATPAQAGHLAEGRIDKLDVEVLVKRHKAIRTDLKNDVELFGALLDLHLRQFTRLRIPAKQAQVTRNAGNQSQNQQ